MTKKLIFTVEEKELERADKWIKQQQEKHGNKVGSIGDRFSYLFSPTGLGVLVSVLDRLTGETEDITDMDLW